MTLEDKYEKIGDIPVCEMIVGDLYVFGGVAATISTVFRYVGVDGDNREIRVVETVDNWWKVDDKGLFGNPDTSTIGCVKLK
jgi:hypothetical protein